MKNVWKRITGTEWAGSRICYYDVLDSTNEMANQLAGEGAEHGTLVIADRQEAGRGRRGRSWESPAKSGIFMSLLLRPQINPENAPMLTLVAALAVTKAVMRMTELDAQIKWPNDIVVNGKKICGILTEMNLESGRIGHIVIGIGINVHNEAFPQELSECATSIYLESGKRISRRLLIEAVWEEFEAYYAKFLLTEDLSGLVAEYNGYLVNRSRMVQILDPKEPYQGVAQGITARGELVVEVQGEMRFVDSGEVSVRGIYGYV